MMTVSRSISSPCARKPGTWVSSVRRPTIRSDSACATFTAGVFCNLMLKNRWRLRFWSSNRSRTASTIANASVPPTASTDCVRLSALNRSGTRAEPASAVPSSVTPAGAPVPAAPVAEPVSNNSRSTSTAVSASAFCKREHLHVRPGSAGGVQCGDQRHEQRHRLLGGRQNQAVAGDVRGDGDVRQQTAAADFAGRGDVLDDHAAGRLQRLRVLAPGAAQTAAPAGAALLGRVEDRPGSLG